MSDLLAIGRSGVVAYRAALSTVGENVSNAETEGYTRRTVDLGESAVSTSTNYNYRSSAVFGGVDVNSVQRVADNYRSSYARLATSDAARADAKATWLNTAEGALDDSDVGLGVKMASVFNAVESLSADVTSDTTRSAVLSAVGEATNQFNTTATSLKAAADGVSTSAQNTVDQLNGDLKTLAQINVGLRRAGAGTAGAALLEDQRDATLQRISGAVGVNVKIQDDGTADVSLANDYTTKLVDSSKTYSAYVGMLQSSDGRLSLVVSGLQDQKLISPQTGSLAGYVDVAGTIASRRQTLDGIAANFSSVINTWNQAGVDKNGNPGAALVTGTTASTLAAPVTDPALVAAASTDGIANGNALALKNTRNSGGPEAQWALLVSTHAQAVASAKSEQSATSAQKDGALQQLDEVTGVDLDVEAAQLLRFQQAYSGSTRIIQVARETLQEILSLIN